jgi:protein-disulfide isomerase
MTDNATNDQRSPPVSKLSARDLLTPIAIIIAAVMISGSIVWSARLQSQLIAQSIAPTQSESALPPPPPVDIAKVNLRGEPFIGKADAPVVMAYWFDYQCPFCKQNEGNVFPQAIKDYVDTGKLKIVFKDFQFLGPDSQTAGLAARAVWEVAPDKFHNWHKAMFDHQGEENSGWATKDKILTLTKSVPGIDVAKVEELMSRKSAEYTKAMEADQAEGGSMGVNGTPAFIIGKKMIDGAMSYETLKAAIDAVLSPT